MNRLILLVILQLLLIFTPRPSFTQNPTNANYEVYALSYGVFPDFPVSALLAGADKTRKIDLQMMVWLIKGPGGKNILVDTGCYRHHRRDHLSHALGSCRRYGFVSQRQDLDSER